MKSKRIFLLLLTAIIVSAIAVAQKPGYTRYQVTKYINNGRVEECAGKGFGQWVKFEGNILWIDNGITNSRYVFNSRRSDGSLLYYFTAWNHGTIYQGSGWQINYNNYAIVSSDHTLINEKVGDITAVLRIQTTDDVGRMIE